MRRPDHHRRISLGAILATVAIWACSESGTTNPPQPVPTTVTLSKTTVSLDAFGATDQLTATVKDQSGNTMSTAVSWSSSDAGVATVTGGLVTAVANGQAQVTATAGSANGSATVTVAQLPGQVTKVAGDAQTDTVTKQLGTDLIAQVNDRLGNAMSGVMVNFAVSAGGGTAAPTSGMTNMMGQATTQWTLGTVAGSHTVTATPAMGTGSAGFTAIAQADVADSVFMVSGDGQSGIIGGSLAAPLIAKVVDQYLNAVTGHTVTFTPGANSGTVNPTSAQTNGAGEAATLWQLGNAVGAQTVEATTGGLKGDPVTFGATAASLGVTGVSPDTVVEGASAIIGGTGFSTTLANNAVTIDGAAATVTAASATSLTVTVPLFSCQPARDVDIQVTVLGSDANLVSHPLQAANSLDMSVGDMTLVSDPAEFCLQFAPGAGGDQYLVGVGSAAELPTSFMVAMMTGVQGATQPPGVAPTAPIVARYREGTGSFIDTDAVRRRAAHYEAEQVIRTWEREHLDPARNPALISAVSRTPSAAMAVPNEGDTLRLHVPNVNSSNVCDSIGVDVVVKTVGSAGIFVTDLNNPAADSLTDAEIQAYSDTFDLYIYDADTTYFGLPSDLDANQRIFVVLTVEVNKFLGGTIAGFVFSGDLFDPSTVCATSDQGEIFYGHVPDPANEAGTLPRSKAQVLFQMPSLIAHEFAHNIQQSRRIIELQSGVAMSSWEAEGQASLAEEVVGHNILGKQTGQNYGVGVALVGGGATWYRSNFTSLATYYGWNGGGARNANAPEECTLFGNQTINNATPCQAFWFYGASWSFQRYVADRFGPSYPGGESALTRDWIVKNGSLAGVPNVEALLGVEFDSLFARWAAMHYVDDNVPGVDPSVQMRSWDLDGIMNGISSMAPLDPAQQALGNFNFVESVRGGSTLYRLLTAGTPRPGVALRVRDNSGQILGSTMRPQLWIVRVQ